jgi:alkylhydroperoxidase family enzyme
MTDNATAPRPTARVALVMKPSDYPGTPDEKTKADLDALFKHMFPQSENPEIPGTAAVFGVIAQNPALALHIIRASDYFVRQNEFTVGRTDLRQLLIQTLCYALKCDFNFTAHIKPAAQSGISVEQQALIPFWRTTNAFNDEQKLVIEYTYAVVSGDVPEELFARVVKHFGEKTAIECTVAIAWWSFFSMIANAAAPQFDFGYGPTNLSGQV